MAIGIEEWRRMIGDLASGDGTLRTRVTEALDRFRLADSPTFQSLNDDPLPYLRRIAEPDTIDLSAYDDNEVKRIADALVSAYTCVVINR